MLTETAAAYKALLPHGKSLSDAVAFYVSHLEAMAKHDATPLPTVVKRFLDEKEREGHSAVHLADLKKTASPGSRARLAKPRLPPSIAMTSPDG